MIDRTKRVYVYFNLHKKVWSVRQSGLVIKHCTHILLSDCRYLVGQAGRMKVLKEKKKNVHAGISGYVVNGSIPRIPSHSEQVTYNPYRYDCFVEKESKVKVTTSDYAELTCTKKDRAVEAIWM